MEIDIYSPTDIAGIGFCPEVQQLDKEANENSRDITERMVAEMERLGGPPAGARLVYGHDGYPNSSSRTQTRIYEMPDGTEIKHVSTSQRDGGGKAWIESKGRSRGGGKSSSQNLRVASGDETRTNNYSSQDTQPRHYNRSINFWSLVPSLAVLAGLGVGFFSVINSWDETNQESSALPPATQPLTKSFPAGTDQLCSTIPNASDFLVKEGLLAIQVARESAKNVDPSKILISKMGPAFSAQPLDQASTKLCIDRDEFRKILSQHPEWVIKKTP